jgi:hypothetical protein
VQPPGRDRPGNICRDRPHIGPMPQAFHPPVVCVGRLCVR